MRLNAIPLLLSLLLAGCAALPGASGPVRSAGHVLRLKPYVPASRSTQALVRPKTVDDIFELALVPERDPGDGVFRTLRWESGEPLDPSVGFDWEQIAFTVRWAPHIMFDRPVTLGGLRANGRYRIVALAYDRKGELISDPEASRVDLTLGDDDAPSVDVPMPVHLVDTAFGATCTLDLAATGRVDRLDHLEVRLKADVGSEPLATYVVTPERLFTPLKLTHLRAQTTYVVEVVALVRDDGAAPAPQTLEVAVGQDDQLPLQAVTVALP